MPGPRCTSRVLVGWSSNRQPGRRRWTARSRHVDPSDAANLDPLSALRTEDSREFCRQGSDIEGVTVPAQEQPAGLSTPLSAANTGGLAALAIFLSRRYALPERVPVFLRAAIERTGIDVPAWVIRWETWVKLSPIERAFESVNFALRTPGSGRSGP